MHANIYVVEYAKRMKEGGTLYNETLHDGLCCLVRRVGETGLQCLIEALED